MAKRLYQRLTQGKVNAHALCHSAADTVPTHPETLRCVNVEDGVWCGETQASDAGVLIMAETVYYFT